MGIHGIKNFLDDLMVSFEFGKIMSQTDNGNIGLVDASLQINKIVRGMIKYDKTNETTAYHIAAMCVFITRLKKHGIIPFFVFDGRSPIQKKDTTNERKEISKNARNKMTELNNQKDRKEIAKSFQITTTMIKECKILLDYSKILYVTSPVESDQQMAAIHSVYPNICGVISDDTDLLVSGDECMRLLFDCGTNKQKYLLKKDVIKYLTSLANQIYDKHNKQKRIDTITREQFVDFAILFGNDYIPNDVVPLLDYVGSCTMKKNDMRKIDRQHLLFEYFVLNDFDIHSTIQTIKREYIKRKQEQMDDNDLNDNADIEFLENNCKKYDKIIIESRQIYLHSDIIDPRTICLNQSSLPDVDQLRNYLGKFKIKQDIVDNFLLSFEEKKNTEKIANRLHELQIKDSDIDIIVSLFEKETSVDALYDHLIGLKMKNNDIENVITLFKNYTCLTDKNSPRNFRNFASCEKRQRRKTDKLNYVPDNNDGQKSTGFSSSCRSNGYWRRTSCDSNENWRSSKNSGWLQ